MWRSGLLVVPQRGSPASSDGPAGCWVVPPTHEESPGPLRSPRWGCVEVSPPRRSSSLRALSTHPGRAAAGRGSLQDGAACVHARPAVGGGLFAAAPRAVADVGGGRGAVPQRPQGVRRGGRAAARCEIGGGAAAERGPGPRRVRVVAAGVPGGGRRGRGERGVGSLPRERRRAERAVLCAAARHSL